jgi:hypothetical protein
MSIALFLGITRMLGDVTVAFFYLFFAAFTLFGFLFRALAFACIAHGPLLRMMMGFVFIQPWGRSLKKAVPAICTYAFFLCRGTWLSAVGCTSRAFCLWRTSWF